MALRKLYFFENLTNVWSLNKIGIISIDKPVKINKTIKQKDIKNLKKYREYFLIPKKKKAKEMYNSSISSTDLISIYESFNGKKFHIVIEENRLETYPYGNSLVFRTYSSSRGSIQRRLGSSGTIMLIVRSPLFPTTRLLQSELGFERQ